MLNYFHILIWHTKPWFYKQEVTGLKGIKQEVWWANYNFSIVTFMILGQLLILVSQPFKSPES